MWEIYGLYLHYAYVPHAANEPKGSFNAWPSPLTCLSTITDRLRNKLYMEWGRGMVGFSHCLIPLQEEASIAVGTVPDGQVALDSLIVEHVKVLAQTLWKFIE